MFIGAVVTLAFGLAFLIAGCMNLRGEPLVGARELVGAAIMLTTFAGFYAFIVEAH
jgi:hypothetical protein